MVERRSCHREKALKALGLTEEDFASRGLVAVGYAERELLPPYKNGVHQRRAEKILRYVREYPRAITLRTIRDVEDAYYPGHFPNSKIIEVVGGYASFCIPYAVTAITYELGLYTYTNAAMTFDQNPECSDANLARGIKSESLFVANSGYLAFGRNKAFFYPKR